tara:strand:+ start:2627 stop:3127 length:501 start_codon:yes stop_codon:yes gene_type:complete
LEAELAKVQALRLGVGGDNSASFDNNGQALSLILVRLVEIGFVVEGALPPRTEQIRVRVEKNSMNPKARREAMREQQLRDCLSNKKSARDEVIDKFQGMSAITAAIASAKEGVPLACRQHLISFICPTGQCGHRQPPDVHPPAQQIASACFRRPKLAIIARHAFTL